VASFCRQQGIWGDGLLDHSLAALWRPATSWARVRDDEIVLLLPGLASRRIPAADAGPAKLLRVSFSTHLGSAAHALVAAAVAENEVQALQLVIRSLAAARLATQECTSLRDCITIDGCRSRIPWLPALMVVSVLDQMLRRVGNTPSCPPRPLSLADVLVGSVHGKFNGAYVHPEFAAAQELLTTSAWLGHVVAGRHAMMPVAVAGCLLDFLGRDGADCAGVEHVLLAYYAEAAGGVDQILFVCRRVVKSGRPLLMPGAKKQFDLSRHPVRNMVLARRMLHSLRDVVPGERNQDA
jgi:hypothetical protein